MAFLILLASSFFKSVGFLIALPAILVALTAGIVAVIASTIVDRLLYRRRPPEQHVRIIRKALYVGRRIATSRKCRFLPTTMAPKLDVLVANVRTNVGSSRLFQGAIIDTGATRTCIGHAQARAYARMRGTTLKSLIRPPRYNFSFGGHQSRPLGVIPIQLDTPQGRFVFQAHVVKEPIPLLLGIDHMEENRWFLRNTKGRLVSEEGWSWPVERVGAHYTLRWTDVELATVNVNYSRKELKRLHRHFRHPSPQKLFDLLSTTKLEDLPTGRWHLNARPYT